jgi:hypothetical protein
MSEPRRTAERNAGAFLGPDMLVPAPMNADTAGSGPGEPGPEDEWKIPAWRDDEAEDKAGAVPEPVHAGHDSLLHRLTHRG